MSLLFSNPQSSKFLACDHNVPLFASDCNLPDADSDQTQEKTHGSSANGSWFSPVLSIKPRDEPHQISTLALAFCINQSLETDFSKSHLLDEIMRLLNQGRRSRQRIRPIQLGVQAPDAIGEVAAGLEARRAFGAGGRE